MEINVVFWEELKSYRGLRECHSTLVHWRKEKRRKRKMVLLNKAVWKAAGGNWKIWK